MTRKIIDCRLSPSVTNCTLTITGEHDEVLAAAAQHAVSVHGHADGAELRELLQGALAEESGASQDGAFVQLFEFNTDRIDELDGIQDRFVEAMGNQRTTRWSIVGADRDRPQTYVAIVEFAGFEQAMVNSDNAHTGQFVKELREICTGEPEFRNLDVRRSRPY